MELWHFNIENNLTNERSSLDEWSKFVFRMQDGPRAALFEADGGEWRLATMLRIKKYLQEQLQGHENVKILA